MTTSNRGYIFVLLKQVKPLFKLVGLFEFTFLLIKIYHAFEHAQVMFFLLVADEEVLLHLAPVPNGGVDVGHP